jgi:ribosome-associated protein
LEALKSYTHKAFNPEMVEKKNTEDSLELANTIVEGLREKKGEDIVIIDLTKSKNSIADYFVICSGNSDTQVDALENSVDAFTRKKLQDRPWRVEGKEQKAWILMDYVSVVVHIFLKEKREFYGLEELWGDGKITEFES